MDFGHSFITSYNLPSEVDVSIVFNETKKSLKIITHKWLALTLPVTKSLIEAGNEGGNTHKQEEAMELRMDSANIYKTYM